MMRLAIILICLTHAAFASVDESEFDREFLRFKPFIFVAPTADTFEKTQKVFEHFGVPQEPDSQISLNDLDLRQTEAVLKKRMAFLELKPSFHRFSAILSSGPNAQLFGYQDFDLKQVPDFSLRLAPQPNGNPPANSFHWRLLSAKQNPEPTPLRGLRILLDPGHMGGKQWDEKTGKYVQNSRGERLSEGVLNLQTALLVEQRLQSLGAQTEITRRGLKPVTATPYESLNLETYWRREFQYRSLQAWFQNLLTTAPAGAQLYKNFENSKELKKLRSEGMRGEYFILREDLTARVDVANTFKPDLIIIIHYDANSHELDSSIKQRVKAFVPGAFFPDEFATRQARRDFVRHLLEEKTFEASTELSESIVNNLAATLGAARESAASNSVEVKPGVHARNLSLTRQMTSVPVAYLECAFYNQTREFNLLNQKKYEMDIEGTKTHYSDRLVSIAGAITKGVTSFVQDYR